MCLNRFKALQLFEYTSKVTSLADTRSVNFVSYELVLKKFRVNKLTNRPETAVEKLPVMPKTENSNRKNCHNTYKPKVVAVEQFAITTIDR